MCLKAASVPQWPGPRRCCGNYNRAGASNNVQDGRHTYNTLCFIPFRLGLLKLSLRCNGPSSHLELYCFISKALAAVTRASNADIGAGRFQSAIMDDSFQWSGHEG